MWKRSGGLPPHLRRRPQRRNYRQRTCPTIYTLAAQLPNRTGCSQTPGELESHNLRQMLPGSDQVHRFGRYSSKRNAVLVGNHRPPPIAAGPLLRAFFDTIPSNVHRIDSQAVIPLLGNNRPLVMLHLEYAVLSFGGFLGIGDSYYPLPWKSLNYDTSQGGYVVDLNKGRLEGAPSYQRSDDPDWTTPATAAGSTTSTARSQASSRPGGTGTAR